MKEKLDKITQSKKFLIVLLILLICLVIGVGTYAWFTWTSTNNTSLTLSIGNLADVTFDKGPDININNLAPVFNYTDGVSTTFSINNRDTSGTPVMYTVKINITTISNELKSSDFKFVLLEGTNIISEGDFSTAANGGTIEIVTDSLSQGVTNYTIYFYIDSNNENNSNMMNKSLIGTIEVGAFDASNTAAGYISSLFSKTGTITSNARSHEIDTTHSMIKDLDGNIHYYGTNPNNYINIGDNVQWRIIGVFNGKLKLIRSSQIGFYSWDTSANTSTTNNGYGINEWSQSDLMKLLNPGYQYNQDLNSSGTLVTVNNSLWYNHSSGICYTGRNNSTANSCSFTSTGLAESVKDKIADVTWNLGASNSNVFPNVALAAEKGTTVISNPLDGLQRTTKWTGKVALPSLSDYGYASNLQTCNITLNNYENCYNWITDIITNYNSSDAWLLTPSLYNAYTATSIEMMGSVLETQNVSYNNYVTPVLFIKSNINIETNHTGSSSDPFVVS